MELNNKCFEILKLLYEKEDFISIKDLSNKLGYSERTIRYNIEKIEDICLKKKYYFFKKDYKKGICLIKNEQSKTFFNEYVQNTPDYTYKYTKKERLIFTSAFLLKSNNYVSMENLSNKLFTSISTITKDLTEIEKWFKNRNVYLIKKAGKGIKINIDELTRRALYKELMEYIITPSNLVNYISNISTPNKITSKLLDDLFLDIDKEYIIEQIQYIENQLGEIFSDETFSSLLIHLTMIVHRVKNKCPLNTNNGETTLNNTIEYTLTLQIMENINQHFKINIPKEEIYYFTVHLLGAKVITKDTKYTFEEDEAIEIKEIAIKMIDEISKLYSVNFEIQKDEVIDGLVTHLIPTIYRIKYHKKIINPIYEQMKEKYSDLLKNTQIVCRHLNEYLKEEINEQEISYIAMHFLAAINIKSKKGTNIPQIIIVCGSGYGTAQVIAMQISSLFNVEIKAVLSQREILKNLKLKNECDYIISTVTIANLNNDEYIRISPMFNHEDFLKINKYLSAKFIKSKINYSQIQTAENISNVVMKYNPKTNRRQLQYEILMELIKENNNITNYPISEDLNLSDIITPSFIKMNVYCKTWQEAIEKGTQVLEDKKYINANYKKAIIKNIEEMGPQMLIVPGIVLAHLAPGEYCKKLGFSITTLKRGVIFGYPKHDPVKIIITLSLIDENKYKKPLLQLFNLLQNQQSRNILINAKTKNEILDIIKQYSK